MTDDEDKAISCFNERLAGCDPATFEFSGQGGALFEIVKQEGDKCLIKSSEKTCRIPISFIKTSQDIAKQQGATEVTFLPVVLIFSLGNPTDTTTGKTTNIECSYD